MIQEWSLLAWRRELKVILLSLNWPVSSLCQHRAFQLSWTLFGCHWQRAHKWSSPNASLVHLNWSQWISTREGQSPTSRTGDHSKSSWQDKCHDNGSWDPQFRKWLWGTSLPLQNVSAKPAKWNPIRNRLISPASTTLSLRELQLYWPYNSSPTSFPIPNIIIRATGDLMYRSCRLSCFEPIN